MCCHDLNRRDFVNLVVRGAAGATLIPAATLSAAPQSEWGPNRWDPRKAFITPGKPLTVQPVLMYATPERRHATSWKTWGGVQTEESAMEEAKRITGELQAISAGAGFPMEVRPLLKVRTPEAAARARDARADVTVLYPATGSADLLRATIPASGDAIIFVRHRSGPVYYWYEDLSVQYVKSERPQTVLPNPADPPRLSVNDVVVDESGELQWRLRALYAAKNCRGARIVALGGARGKLAADAPQVARQRFQLDIVEVSYEEFNKRIRSALNDPNRVALAGRWTEQYLALPGTMLDTDRKFVVNAFVLYGAFKDLMEETGATAFTIGNCMRTIMPMAETTACLPLSLLNDEGLLAFCESDFVIIPAGILLRYVAGTPVFLHNSTFPHNAIVTCAHCTGPRRMNGTRYEPVRVLTHYESEYGAAPKVEIPPGQEVSFIDPEYATRRWVGIRGVIESNPFYEICRSQQDVRILGDWKKLINEVRDSHWIMAYGNHLKEVGYAASRFGLTWETVSEA
jgi:hypothetical protein